MKPTGIILCGGESKRMGKNKALLKLGNITLVEHLINILKPICDEIILSVNNHELDFLPYIKVNDKINGIGPISGFYSCLLESKTEENIIISCDTPFITSTLLNLLKENSQGFEIVIPIFKNQIQPLIGLFKKSSLLAIKYHLDKGNYKPINIFENCNTNFLKIELENLPKPDFLFLNINNIEDYHDALKIYDTL